MTSFSGHFGKRVTKVRQNAIIEIVLNHKQVFAENMARMLRKDLRIFKAQVPGDE